MSAISGFGGFGGFGVGSASGNGGRGHRAQGPGNGLKQDLTDYLTSQGVSSDEQTQIQNDVDAILKSLRSEDGRPAPSKVREAVDGVLSEHNIDVGDFATKFHAPPPPSNADDSSESIDATSQFSTNELEQTSDSEDYVKQLLELLSKAAEQFHHRMKMNTDGTSIKTTGEQADSTATNPATAVNATTATKGRHCLPYASNSAESLEVGITLNFTA